MHCSPGSLPAVALSSSAGSLLVPVRAGRARPEAQAGGGRRRAAETFTADQKEHWAYQPLERPELPAVREPRWVRNPIDRFILAGLEEHRACPTPPRPTGSP